MPTVLSATDWLYYFLKYKLMFANHFANSYGSNNDDYDFWIGWLEIRKGYVTLKVYSCQHLIMWQLIASMTPFIDYDCSQIYQDSA